MLAALAASVTVGALAAVAPNVVVGGTLLAIGVIVAWTRPAWTIPACLVAAAFHRGIFLSLRLEPGGYPVSVFDVVPPLLLLSAVSLALKRRESTPAARTPLAVCAAMIVAGLVIGVALGKTQGAADYDLLQVVRLYVLVLCALASALVAGHLPEWRKAVLAGLLGVGIFVAAQLLVSFCWSLATGNYFWSLFPFGRELDTDLLGQVQQGNILTLRENAVAGYLILPAFALIVVHLRRRDVPLLMLLLAGGLVWLSRGLWAALALTLLMALTHRATSGRLSSARLGAVVLPITAVVAVVFFASGGILSQRLGETTDLEGDTSIEGRVSESGANLAALGEGAGPLFLGLGTGVVVSAEGSSALLENGVLATWTNVGLLGLIGVTGLFLGAALRGWRLAIKKGRDREAAALGAMGLALAPLWLEGFIGGILTVPEPALVLFLLAASVLATPVDGVRAPTSRPLARPVRRRGDRALSHV